MFSPMPSAQCFSQRCSVKPNRPYLALIAEYEPRMEYYTAGPAIKGHMSWAIPQFTIIIKSSNDIIYRYETHSHLLRIVCGFNMFSLEYWCVLQTKQSTLRLGEH